MTNRSIVAENITDYILEYFQFDDHDRRLLTVSPGSPLLPELPDGPGGP